MGCQEANDSAFLHSCTGDIKLDATSNNLSPALSVHPSCSGGLALGDVYKLILRLLRSITSVMVALPWPHRLPVCPPLTSLHHTSTGVPYVVENPISLSSACSASSHLYKLPYPGRKAYQFLLCLHRPVTPDQFILHSPGSINPVHVALPWSQILPVSFPLIPLQYSFTGELQWWSFPGHSAYQLLLCSLVFCLIIFDMVAIHVNNFVYDSVRMLKSKTGFKLRFHVAFDIASFKF